MPTKLVPVALLYIVLQKVISVTTIYFSHSKSTMKSTVDMNNIEAEYIKNLQQQIYFLELESNFLYPFLS